MRRALLTLILVALIPLAGECDGSPTPVTDRSGPNGAKADTYADAQHVTVYRNADLVPNVATFCVGAYGFISTIKAGTSSGDVTAPSMLRFPELDKVCAG